MPEGISPFVAGGIAWVCLIVGFLLGLSWAALSRANDEADRIERDYCGGMTKAPESD